MAMQRAHQYLLQRIDTLEEDVSRLRAQLASAPVAPAPAEPSLIPSQPLVGIEVIPKKEVVISDPTPEPISHVDRLLMNTSARMALEEEEAAGVTAVDEEAEAEAEAETEAEEELEEAEAEAEEELEEAEAEEEMEGQLDAAEEEEEQEELEEFEYKGATYYRDSDNTVYMTDADGAPYAIGVWSSVKNRIIMKKPDA